MSRRPGQSSRRATGKIIVPAATVVLPYSVAGASLWLKSDIGITLNSTTVSNWADQSGAANHASSPGGSQLTYNASGGLNNAPYLSAAGAQYLTGSIAVSVLTMFVVARPAGTPSALVAMAQGTGVNTGAQIFRDPAGVIYGRRNSASGSADATYSPTPTFGTVGLFSLIVDSGLTSLKVNDVGPITSAAAGIPYLSDTYRVGTLNLPLAYPLTGDVYEVLIYGSHLSAPDFATVEAGIRAKYLMPTITNVSPSTMAGASPVAITITGTNFVNSATVDVGGSIAVAGTACTSVVVVNSTTITCNTPVTTPVTEPIHVRNPNGQYASSTITFT